MQQLRSFINHYIMYKSQRRGVSSAVSERNNSTIIALPAQAARLKLKRSPAEGSSYINLDLP